MDISLIRPSETSWAPLTLINPWTSVDLNISGLEHQGQRGRMVVCPNEPVKVSAQIQQQVLEKWEQNSTKSDIKHQEQVIVCEKQSKSSQASQKHPPTRQKPRCLCPKTPLKSVNAFASASECPLKVWKVQDGENKNAGLNANMMNKYETYQVVFNEVFHSSITKRLPHDSK